MKLNKTVDACIPRPRDYFKRFGCNNMPANLYTGDVAPDLSQTKMDAIREADANLAHLLGEPERM